MGEWFNGKTAAFKVADLGSNPCSPAKWYRWNLCNGRNLVELVAVKCTTPVMEYDV